LWVVVILYVQLKKAPFLLSFKIFSKKVKLLYDYAIQLMAKKSFYKKWIYGFMIDLLSKTNGNLVSITK